MKTNAVRILDTLGISYELRSYAVDEEHLDAGAEGVFNPSSAKHREFGRRLRR